jgi:hypothetical protein
MSNHRPTARLAAAAAVLSLLAGPASAQTLRPGPTFAPPPIQLPGPLAPPGLDAGPLTPTLPLTSPPVVRLLPTLPAPAIVVPPQPPRAGQGDDGGDSDCDAPTCRCADGRCDADCCR